jgi:hypothetical protein
MRRRILIQAVAVLVVGLAASMPAAARARDGVQPTRWIRSEPRAREALPAGIECRTPTGTQANKLLDCPRDDTQPTNTPTIAVDPADPRHMVVVAFDFPNGSMISEAYVTFDGGRTWASGDLPLEAGRDTASDSSLSFDVEHGTIVYTAMTWHTKPDGDACRLGVAASVSTDGGLHWSVPRPIAQGRGCIFGGPGFTAWAGIGVVTDTNPSSEFAGRMYVVGHRGDCRPAPCDFANGSETSVVYAAHSDDGGFTWSDPQDISGSSPEFCTAYATAPACDVSLHAWPAVSPDGTVHVAFSNAQNQAAWEPGECCEGQILTVSSTDGGATWSDPVHVTDLEDGSRDLPNFEAEFTGWPLGGVSGTQLTTDIFTWNLASSPLDGTLYVVFSDNRDGVHDSDKPVTNLDVFVMTSKDGGATWTGPDVVSDAPSDQWNAFPDVNPVTGELGVEYIDRSYGSDQAVDITFATGHPGSFTSTRVTTVSSSLRDNLWFPAGVPGCETCASWIGEYVRFAYGPDGTANLVWTDLRRYVSVPGLGIGYTENIFSARL